ncbi:MAG: methyltransferase domain-containing protein [Gammaproteobacteria bacterium]|nr:methyltransferase domain-containing protein [Gammaproteobacteria bacterium]
MTQAQNTGKDLEWNGERYIPGVKGEIELEHIHRYMMARELAAEKEVLDIASGEGYGSAILGQVAKHVIGVDISQEAVAHASRRYGKDNVEFRGGSCIKIPLMDASVDMVVSFETIEHIDQHDAMMREIIRVLRPDGICIISSPEKFEYSESRDYCNPYHIKELYRHEFKKLLEDSFAHVVIFGQRVIYGSGIFHEQSAGPIVSYDAKSARPSSLSGMQRPKYLIAVASGNELPTIPSSFYEQSIAESEIICNLSSMLSERGEQIDILGKTVESLVIDRDAHKNGLEQLQCLSEDRIRQRDESISELAAVVAQRDAIIATLEKSIESLVIDRDAHKNGLEQLQCLSEDRIRQRDEKVARLRSENATQAEQLRKSVANLEEIYRSSSWRLTAPLRKMVTLFRIKPIILRLSRRLMGSRQVPERASNIVPEASVDPAKYDPKQLRILLVSYYCPTRAHAGGLRILDIYALIRRKRPDVQIDLLTHHRPEIDWSLDDARSVFDNVYISKTEKLTPSVLTSLRSTALRYDVVDLQFHDAAREAEAFREIGDKVIFTPMESLTKVLLLELRSKNRNHFGSIRKLAGSIKAAIEEMNFIGKVDQVVCVSRADAALLRLLVGSRYVSSVDTGVSQFEFAAALEPDFVPSRAADRPRRILYVAYFGSETNVTALRWYLEKVHPLVKARVPDYVLTVVGRGDLSSFHGYQDNSVELVGEVQALGPFIENARVGIAPALGGSGFRGKVNQYAVMGVPCVVTSIALKGLGYRNGVNILVADAPEVFADNCSRLLEDCVLNDQISQAARELCRTRYTWESKWPAISKIYKI